MKMGRSVLVSLGALAIMCVELAMAANYTVGGSNGGWDQATDLTTWASSQTFTQGDNLIFQYTQNHDVTEVSKADFDSCSASKPLQPPRTGGLSVVALSSAGSRFFICGSGGHCLGGMKMQIDTLAASAPPPAATPSPPSSPPPSTTTPPPRSATPSPPPATTAPPPKGTTPSPPPKISPKPSPPSKAAGDNTTSPPSSAPPPSASLPPPPPPSPSSAARFNVVATFSACSGFALIAFLNL